MKDYIENYLDKFRLPAAKEELLLALDKAGEQCFTAARKLYQAGALDFITRLKNLADKTASEREVNLYHMNALIVLSLFEELARRHLRRGIPKDVTDKTLQDLVFKMQECKTVFGVYGVMEISWYTAILTERTYGIGRLQFELDEFRLDRYERNGVSLQKGDRVISVHIPSSGEPFDREARRSSYERATAFFNEFFPQEFGEYMPFVSWTWLLNPKNDQIMPSAKNCLDFKNEFTILESEEYKSNDSVAWRIFGVPMIKKVSDLPEATAMQQSVKSYLIEGGMLGWGYGIFIMRK